MKGIERDIMFAIGILVIGLIFLVVFLEKLGIDLWKTNFDEKALQAQVENQEKELKETYDSYSKNDGGFDAYEASVLVAKVIEYTWRDCYNICDDEKELFTGFFVKYPINFIKSMDCSSYPRSSGGKIYPDIARIRNMCSTADIGTDKTQKVDEWTVTAWGLANTTMCSNYKLSSKEDSKQWGNGVCDGDASTAGKKCTDFCDRSGAGIDKIDWEAGTATKGNTYGNIRIIYVPEGWLSVPKIIVKEISTDSGFSLSTNLIGGYVDVGSSTTATVTATLKEGTAQPISFSCSNLPAGASCTFNPSSVTPTSAGTTSILTISTTSSTLVGGYSINIIGTDGISTKTIHYSLTVQTVPTPIIY